MSGNKKLSGQIMVKNMYNVIWCHFYPVDCNELKGYQIAVDPQLACNQKNPNMFSEIILLDLLPHLREVSKLTHCPLEDLNEFLDT